MELKQPDFFQEVTLRICSSLDVNTAFSRTFEYLESFFPVCECFFQIYDDSLGAVRNLAYKSIDESIPPTARRVIPFPQHVWDWSLEQTSAFRVYRTSPNQVIRDLAEVVGVTGNEDLCLPLWTGDRIIGVFVLRTCGSETFSDDHVGLINIIREPLSIAMSNALAHEATVRYRDMLIDDNQFLKKELQQGEPKDIIGAKGGLAHVMEMVSQVAPLANTVLLLGETGVGKEVIANAIHYSSPRKDKPFIKVNCGAIPENLVDSELFGHEKGAFTGALARKRGRFERADGGTLFLDEIGELPLAAQVKLLRVIQHNEIERVGSSETIPVNVRVIAATHRDLEQMIAENRFREDLWFRLNVFPIVIPPLRQRLQDVFPLTQYFIEGKCRNMGISMIPSLAPGALTRLESYHWPGNVRELENVIERELIRYPGGPLSFGESLGGAVDTMPQNKSVVDKQKLQRLDEVVAGHIQTVLKSTRGKVSGPGGAAEILGMNDGTLRAKMKKLKIPFGRRTFATRD